MSKLWDVFLYSGAHEHDLVRLRYMTLKDHVDRMYAVACNLTYQGDPSPGESIPDELDGLGMITVQADPFPDKEKSKWGGRNWGHVEYQHRNNVPNALKALGAEDDDIIMLSDFDEIPDPRFLQEIKTCANMFGWVAVPMRMHGFALDYLYPTQLLYTVACRLKDMDPQNQRNNRYSAMRAGWGWHLSWLGDLEAKERKKKWFSHGELDDLDVEDCYKNGLHANGEELIHLTADQIDRFSWPVPMLTGDFEPPSMWWSPDCQRT